MTRCVLVARTVSACRHGKAPSRDSPHATCARTSLEQADLRGKYLRWSNFPSHRGSDSDPARASCSVHSGWLSSSLWGLCCQIPCEPPVLRPLWGGGFRAAALYSTRPLAKWQPPVANMSTTSAISAGQGEEKSFPTRPPASPDLARASARRPSPEP